MKRTIFKCIAFWLLALFLVFVLSVIPVSCRSLKSKESYTRKDSLSTNISYKKKDTIITVPGQTLRLSVPVLQLDRSPAEYKTERGTLTIKKEGENISAECDIAEYKAAIVLLEKTVSVYSKTVTSQEKLIKEQKSMIAQLYDLLKLAGGLALLFFAIAVFFIVRKKTS